MFIFQCLLLSVLISSFSVTPLECKEDHTDSFSLTEIEGKWTLIASATWNEVGHKTEEQVDYAWLEFLISQGQVKVKDVRSSDGFRRYGERVYTDISKTNGIIKLSGMRLSDPMSLYKWKNNLLVSLTIKLYLDKTVPLLLFSRATNLSDSELEEFKQLSACKNYKYVSLRRNLIDYALICENNSLKSVTPINTTEIAGRWTIVAKANKKQEGYDPTKVNITGWIEFSVNGDQVTYRDSRRMDDQKDGVSISVTKDSLVKDDDDTTEINLYRTCKDCLLLNTQSFSDDINNIPLYFHTRSGKVNESDFEKFKFQAICESLTEISVIPEALEQDEEEMKSHI
ncbi:uncharacterized protein LOC115473214 [Microcaecilia unicolor]|uniref:Uncharacterized protein LOC115473214 n=1 Tax=Microcaecilia unicolor TaxID=1415580 RepID=A0A6P7YLG6_9AMPH|nr:uncharacterized protein LOC115473214 [Microcaecilia unicolor]